MLGQQLRGSSGVRDLPLQAGNTQVRTKRSEFREMGRNHSARGYRRSIYSIYHDHRGTKGREKRPRVLSTEEGREVHSDQQGKWRRTRDEKEPRWSEPEQMFCWTQEIFTHSILTPESQKTLWLSLPRSESRRNVHLGSESQCLEKEAVEAVVEQDTLSQSIIYLLTT